LARRVWGRGGLRGAERVMRGEFSSDAWRARLNAAGLRSPLDLLKPALDTRLGGRWQPLTKPGLRGRERWRWELDGAPTDVLFLKRYTRPPLNQQWDRFRRQTWRHSRAWWEYRQSHELARRGVPVARAVAVAERMAGPLELDAAVLLEAAPGTALDRIWPSLCAAGAPVTRGRHRHTVVRGLALFVSAFHQTGLCHRDLYLCHIFAELDPVGAVAPCFTLIDLARAHRPRWRRLRWIIKDLAQLDFSARQVGATRTDRLRFLITYLGLEPSSPRVRFYARRIVRKSARILRRELRRSRRP